MPERKVPLGVAEADALAAWLERVASDTESDPIDDHYDWERKFVREARAWADKVRPVKIGGVVMRDAKP